MTTKPIHILFVCLGNTCRSPVAALLAQELWGDAVTTSSAGVDTAGGRLAPQFGKESIATLDGISDDAKARMTQKLELHRSQAFAPMLAADVIVALQDDVRDKLVAVHGIPEERIVVLGVDDPWRSTPDRALYVKSTNEIHAALLAKRDEIFRKTPGG